MEHPSRNICAEKEIDSPSIAPDEAAVWQSPARLRSGIEVFSDLPELLPVTTEEIGLLRAFLCAEIDPILRNED